MFLIVFLLFTFCYANTRWIRREEIFGYGSEVEEGLLYNSFESNRIHRLFLSTKQEFVIVCNTRSVLFYRVLTYPNMYPYSPYLFYGYYQPNDFGRIKDCVLELNDSVIIEYDGGECVRLERIRSTKSEDKTFRIIFPIDQHIDRWEQKQNEPAEACSYANHYSYDESQIDLFKKLDHKKESITTLPASISNSLSNEKSHNLKSNFVDEIDGSTFALLERTPDRASYELYFRLKNITGPHYSRLVTIQLKTPETIITSMALFRFRTPYVCLGTSDGQWFILEFSDLEVPTMYDSLYPMIGDFYLPPAKDFLARGEELRELDDETRVPMTRFLLIFTSIYILWKVLGFIRLKNWSFAWAKKMGKTIWICCFLILLSISLEEIFSNKPLFLIDFPAYIRHIEQLVWGKGTFLRYDRIMHYHGPCTYGGGFVLLYLPIYGLWKFVFGKFLGVSLLGYFRVLWVALELVLWMLLRSIFMMLGISNSFIIVLSIVSNRLHLYNTRVLINDLPGVILEFIIIRSILMSMKRKKISRRDYLFFSLLYGLLLSYKLNFIFFLPPLLIIIFKEEGFIRSIASFCVILGTQITVSLPFIASSRNLSYFRNAFDFSRELLWDKTRYFTFVGRKDFSSSWFKRDLILLIIGFNGLFTLQYLFFGYVESSGFENKGNNNNNNNNKKKKKKKMLTIRRRLVFRYFFMFNFVCITFAKGLYTPFLCWFFYSLPMLMEVSGFSFLQTLMVWVGTEICFRRNSSKEVEITYSIILFALYFSVVFDAVVKFTWTQILEKMPKYFSLNYYSKKIKMK